MQRTPGETPKQREQYWLKIISEARAYKAGVTAYCRDHGIQKNNYYSWFKRLRKHHPEWQDLSNNIPAKKPKKVRPETEVIEKASRRRFTSDYKTKVLNETDNLDTAQVSAVLRREGLYSTHLKKWRAERDLRMLEPSKRGKKANPESAELRRLRKDNQKLQRKLEEANQIIDFQKKISEILGIKLKPIEEDD